MAESFVVKGRIPGLFALKQNDDDKKGEQPIQVTETKERLEITGRDIATPKQRAQFKSCPLFRLEINKETKEFHFFYTVQEPMPNPTCETLEISGIATYDEGNYRLDSEQVPEFWFEISKIL